MFNLLLCVAAIAFQPQIPVIRPLPAPQPAPTTTIQQVDAGRLAVKFLPDLIVDEVRVEGDSTAHFRITNKGTADAVGPIRLTADAYIDGRRGNTPIGMAFWVENLAMGESKWIAVKGFAPLSEPYYAGKDYSFPLGKATAFTARVDPPVVSGGFLGGDSSRDFQEMFGGGKSGPKCDSIIGCIRETDETNNSFRADGAAISQGKP